MFFSLQICAKFLGPSTLIKCAFSGSDSALSTAVYAAALMQKSGFTFSKTVLQCSKSVMFNSEELKNWKSISGN